MRCETQSEFCIITHRTLRVGKEGGHSNTHPCLHAIIHSQTKNNHYSETNTRVCSYPRFSPSLSCGIFRLYPGSVRLQTWSPSWPLICRPSRNNNGVVKWWFCTFRMCIDCKIIIRFEQQHFFEHTHVYLNFVPIQTIFMLFYILNRKFHHRFFHIIFIFCLVWNMIWNV